MPGPHSHTLTWLETKFNGRPALQIMGELQVTNISADGVSITDVRIIYPRLKIHQKLVLAPAHPSPHSDFSRIIAPGEIADMYIMLSSERPSALKKGDDLALDLSFYDQFNNEHPVATLTFRSF
jgi:hypothetical protein